MEETVNGLLDAETVFDKWGREARETLRNLEVVDRKVNFIEDQIRNRSQYRPREFSPAQNEAWFLYCGSRREITTRSQTGQVPVSGAPQRRKTGEEKTRKCQSRTSSRPRCHGRFLDADRIHRLTGFRSKYTIHVRDRSLSPEAYDLQKITARRLRRHQVVPI
jgi:hypothetical protein